MPSKPFTWNFLLEAIEKGTVIPIVGQELLRAEVAGAPQTYEAHIARQLAADLGLECNETTVNGVVVSDRGNIGRLDEVAERLMLLHAQNGFPIPTPLDTLAGIEGFRLFVSTTCDDLLARALTARRGRAPEKWAFSPNDTQDLSPGFLSSNRTGVYHLLGRVDYNPNSFVMTEAQILEFFHALHSFREERLPRLGAALRENHLLLLGTGFPDWLKRIFLRLAKQGSLFESDTSGGKSNYVAVADETLGQEKGFITFVDRFSRITRVYDEGNAVDFVRQLGQRWQERKAARGGSVSPMPVRPPAESSAPPAVFLAYSSRDVTAAEAIYRQLTDAGLKVWFDRPELKERSGYDYEVKIRDAINTCTAFVPVLSQHNVRSSEPGYFRKEWSWAKARLDAYAGLADRPVHPVIIDDVTNAEAEACMQKVFECRLQLVRADTGRLPQSVVDNLIHLVRLARTAGVT